MGKREPLLEPRWLQAFPMVIFLFIIALKMEEENGLSDGDFACGALALGGGEGHRGVRRGVGEAVSWLARLVTCKTLRPGSATTCAPTSGVIQRGSETWVVGGLGDAGGNVRGK